MGNLCVSRGKSGGGLAQANSDGNPVRNPSFAKTQNQLILASGGDSGLVLGAEDSVEMSQGNGKSAFMVEAGSTSTSSTRPHVVLVPHQHTLFCERKQRVCTAVGKSQEMEVLKVQNLPAKHSKGYWFRTTSKGGTIGDLKYAVIPGTENKLEYKLQKEDVGHFIGFSFDSDKGKQFAENIVGPILPGPPRLLEFRIEGDVKEGGVAKVEADYIGGYEGASEYWWMRIYPTGQRTQVTQPTAIPTNGKESGNDPRHYKLTKDDVGCTLKAKCRPKRTDGVQGEIFTSKSSGVILN
eukprot:gene27155-32801_t